MQYIIYAILGAICTSLTTILAKIGLKKVNSNFATLIKTIIVILFSLILALISGAIYNTVYLTLSNWIYIILSGLSTGLSRLFYFKALKEGDVNKVAPIDKSSFILTSILFLIFFFNSVTNNGDVLTIIMLILSMILMLSGTILMIDKKQIDNNKKISKKWLIYAILSSIFAALVSFFIKFGLNNVSSYLITFYRTIVVFIFALAIVLIKKDYKEVKYIDKKGWIFLILSGISTGLAWLFEYASLANDIVNPIVMTSISKLSILLTMFLSFILLKEKFSIKSLIGLTILTSGIVLIIVFGL